MPNEDIKKLLNENDVVQAVHKYLEEKGFEVESANTKETGIDIFGRKNDEHWIIEAKGETSSEKSSKRYGKLMTKNQHYSQVSTCLYKLIQRKNKEVSKKGFNYGMAFPKNTIFKDLIKSIYPTLSKLEISIFWVDNNLSVEQNS